MDNKYDIIKPLKNGNNRLLGIDYGLKHTGVAISDSTWIIASPLLTIQSDSRQKTIAKIQEILSQHNIAAIIFGYPINMNGSEGPQCQKVKNFAEFLATHIDIPITFWDERWSTTAITRTMIEADLSRKRQKEVVDKMAASFILQGFLDHLNGAFI